MSAEINVIVLMDEDLLTELEHTPANKVLGMMDASSEQLKSALQYIRSGEPLPEQLAGMVFHIEELKILSSIENHGSTDPRTNVEDDRFLFLVHRFTFMSEDISVDTM